jgi:hypothetical protein
VHEICLGEENAAALHREDDFDDGMMIISFSYNATVDVVQESEATQKHCRGVFFFLHVGICDFFSPFFFFILVSISHILYIDNIRERDTRGWQFSPLPAFPVWSRCLLPSFHLCFSLESEHTAHLYM